jgi:hypothetical protein
MVIALSPAVVDLAEVMDFGLRHLHPVRPAVPPQLVDRTGSCAARPRGRRAGLAGFGFLSLALQAETILLLAYRPLPSLNAPLARILLPGILEGHRHQYNLPDLKFLAHGTLGLSSKI